MENIVKTILLLFLQILIRIMVKSTKYNKIAGQCDIILEDLNMTQNSYTKSHHASLREEVNKKLTGITNESCW